VSRGVEVSVLGPARVCGTTAPFHRTAALDLVVYLAFHRGGVSHAAWSLALWPDQPISAATVHSTASDARRALGDAPDGAAYVTRGKELRLHPAVTTDVQRFARLAGSEDPDEVLGALALVRGPVLSDLRRADWAIFDGTKAQIESLVAAAARRGADHLLRNGQPDRAEWVVRQAIAASPYDERLYRALLRALAAQGNRLRLRTAMGELLALAGEGGIPVAIDCLHPRTTALYRGLLRGAPAVGGHAARL
jgi:DNA-binding SARP family transcriptional activator